MKLGIIVYSKTGNTLSVAKRIQEKLEKDGQTAVIEQVVPLNETSNPNEKIELRNKPDVNGYDALIFASPVHAFSLAPVMKTYIEQISNLSGKKISCFMTQQFPYKWMGGNHAIKQLKAACIKAGGTVTGENIVNWSNKKREEMIEKTVATSCNL